jgi:hypothetical protein
VSVWLNTTKRIWPPDGSPIEKPCWSLGWCPYGQLVEAYPLHPEADQLAREKGWFVRWDATPHTEDNGVTYPGSWQQCEPEHPEARPDINRLLHEGYLETGYNCLTFGHDCPVFYHAELIEEE